MHVLPLLSICLLAVLSTVSGHSQQPVPVLLHSNQANEFVASSSSDVLSAEGFTSLIQDIIVTPSHQSSLVSSSTPAPEVLVAVVYDELDFATVARAMGAYGRATDSPLSQIKPAMSSAASSLTIPYATPSTSSMSTAFSILSTVHRVSPSSTRFVLDTHPTATYQSATLVSTCSQLLSTLTDTPTLFNNGQTDVIVIATTVADTCVAEIRSFLTTQKATHTVMYTAEKAIHQVRTTFGEKNVVPVSAYAVGATPTTTTLRHNLHFTTGPTRLTPNILIGILVMLFLLFMLYMGVNCLMAVERPVRMSSTVLQISKEY